MESEHLAALQRLGYGFSIDNVTDLRLDPREMADRGVKFVIGTDDATELTEKQIHEQCKMYIAAVRIAHEFGCAAIGIQYQQGLKDMAPASDLVEGLLNNVDRPPVYHAQTGEELFAGQAIPHFNEVDECAGLDGLVTNEYPLEGVNDGYDAMRAGTNIRGVLKYD